jgi:microcystin-dependent protein
MAKTKISEFDLTPANNTDIDGINIAEGCAPSGINNAIRELMSQLKAQQDGSSGDPFTITGTLTASTVVSSGTITSSGTLAVTGNLTMDGAAGTSGQVLTSAGSGATPTWTTQFVTGMIMMWSGSIATIPSGWALCNGSNGTPDLRNRFVIGAHSDDSGTAKTTVTGSSTQTGGSKDAVNVSHTHTATSTVTDPGHTHQIPNADGALFGTSANSNRGMSASTSSSTTGITVATSISTEGSSGTNANLPPYYALAYIMKT